MIGRVAYSKAGHDKDQAYVIVAQENEYVYLCDGRLKTLSKPKKKKIKHLQLTNVKVSDTLFGKLVHYNEEMAGIQSCDRAVPKAYDTDIKYELKCLMHV